MTDDQAKVLQDDIAALKARMTRQDAKIVFLLRDIAILHERIDILQAQLTTKSS